MSMPDLASILGDVVKVAVREAMAEHMVADAKLSVEALALNEAQAAQAMGVAKHSLRDARLRGLIHGRLLGKKIVYDRRELLRFLAEPSP